jgi:hypothetical protein
MYRQPSLSGVAFGCADDERGRRRASIRVAVLAVTTLAVVLLYSSRAFGLLISEPTVSGPAESVHHVGYGGFDEGGYVWVSAQGSGRPEVHAAVWETGALAPGAYAVEAWMPNEAGTADARYEIIHDGIINEVLVSQYEVISGEWVTLGTYEFDEPASVRSSDSAGDPGDRIDWSDMRWTKIASLPAQIETSGLTTTVREPVLSGPEPLFAQFAGVGYDGGSLLVGEARGKASATVDLATWSAPLPADEYGVEAFIPEAHHEAEVEYLVHAANGALPVQIAQSQYKNAWAQLGRYQFDGVGEVTSSDATGSPGQDIAWSALRFVQLSTPPVEAPGDSPQPAQSSVTAEPPHIQMTAPRRGSARSPRKPAGVVLALVPVPGKLLKFAELHIEGGHQPHPGPADLYKVLKLLHRKLKVRYRCDPCLIADRPLRLDGSDTPSVHTSYAEGTIHELIARAPTLYKGTTLRVEVRERHHRHTWLTYELMGDRSVHRSGLCAARPGPIGACPR